MPNQKFTAQQLEALEEAAEWFLEFLKPVQESLFNCFEILNDALEEINEKIEDSVMKLLDLSQP